MSVQSNYKTRMSQSLGNGLTTDLNVYLDVLPNDSTGYLVFDPEGRNYELAYYESKTVVSGNSGYVTCPASNGRGLSLTATTRTSVSGNQKNHGPGTRVIQAPDHYLLNDKASLSGNNTFTGTQTFSGPTIFTGSSSVPVFANAAARDAAIPSPTNGMEAYLTDTGKFTDYTAGAWLDRESGGTFPNASITVAGKVEKATDAETIAGTAAGATGAQLAVGPDNLLSSTVSKAVSAGVGDAGKFVRAGASGTIDPSFYDPTVLYTGITEHETYTPASLAGGAPSALALFDSVNNASIRTPDIDGVAYNVDGMDLTSATSYADVAAIIQTDLRAVTGGQETCEHTGGVFVFTSGDTTSASSFGVLTTSTGTVGTDISGAGATPYLNANTGNGVETVAALNISADAGKAGLTEANGLISGELIASNQTRRILGGTVSVRDAVKFNSSGQIEAVDEDTFSSIIMASVTPTYTGSVGSVLLMAVDTNRNIVLLTYTEGGDSDAMALAVRVFEDGNARFGASIDINTSEQAPVDIAWNSTTGGFLVVSYGGTDDVGAVAVTVNSDTLVITPGTAVSVKNGSGGAPTATVAYDPVQLAYLVISVTNTATEYRVLTVSGVTITQGTAASFVTSGTTSALISEYHPPSGKVIIFYRNGTTNRLVVAATVDGTARTATFGTPVTVSTDGSGVGDNGIAYDPVSEQILLVYETTNVLGRLCSVSGTTVSLVGTETTLITGGSSIASRNMVAYSDYHKAVFVSANTSSKMARVTISGTTLTSNQFTAFGGLYIAALTNSKQFFALDDDADPASFIVEFRAEDVANTVGLAAEAGSSGDFKRINLMGAVATGFTGLTPGDKYVVGGYELGRAISSTEVFLTKNP